MRTTLTLDDDVAAELEKVMQSRGLTLKAAVNDALRVGLTALQRKTSKKRYRLEPVSVVEPLLTNLDDVAEVLGTLDGPGLR